MDQIILLYPKKTKMHYLPTSIYRIKSFIPGLPLKGDGVREGRGRVAMDPTKFGRKLTPMYITATFKREIWDRPVCSVR